MKISILVLVLALLAPLSLHASDQPAYSLEKIKSSLSNNQISQGPDSNQLTRSASGPSLYRNTADAVVLVYAKGLNNQDAMGSGVLISSSGLILTNWHVARANEFVAIIFRPKAPKTMADLTDDDVWIAKNIGINKEKDVALLQLVGSVNEAKKVDLSFTKFIPLENPLSVEVGQDVFAIGHPQGLFWSYTEGVISQIRPRYKWSAGGDNFQATIVQTQTAITHGSSGGPLINQNGKLVGLVSSMLEGQAGFNFAIGVHELVSLLGR